MMHWTDSGQRIVNEVLIRHTGGICVGTFGDECLCGWRGESWEAHVTPLIVAALRDSESAPDPRGRAEG